MSSQNVAFFHNLKFAHNSFTKDKITDTFQEPIAGIMACALETLL